MIVLFKSMLRRGNSYIIFLVGALIVSGLLFSCSDGGPSDPGLNGNGENGTGPENSPMEITVEVPEQYRLSDPPEHRFSVEDQDGFSQGLITYSENGTKIWEKSLEGFSETRWDTAWTPAPEQHGEALLEYTIHDDFDGEKETQEESAQIVILPPGNAPGSIEAEYSSFTAQVESQIRFEVSDPDTLLEISFEETDPDGNTTSFTVQPVATYFDTTLYRTYTSTGEAVWTVTASDKHPEPETISEEFAIQVQEPGANTPATITANIPEVRAGQQAEFSFSVSDPDTIAFISLTETLSDGSENSFEVAPGSTEWDTTIARTYAESGKLKWSVSATDKHPLPETTTKEFEVDVLAKMVSYTLEGMVTNPVLEIPAIEVSTTLYGSDGSVLAEAETDGQGVVSLAHTQPEDEPVEGFRIELQANGYLDAEESVNLNQESFSVELEPTSIEFASATDEIEPRGNILIDLAELVNTSGVSLEEVTVEQTTANLSTVQENGTTYRLSVENDVAATTESITIRARTSTNDQSGQVEVPIGERAFISITQSQFEVPEDDSLALNLANYVNSGADIDSLHISTSASQLEIIRDGSGLYRLIPDKDFYGDLQVDLYAINVHGSEATLSGLLQVERLPRATVRVENNETNEHTPGLTAHLGVYDSSGELTDSLSSSDGVFEIKLREVGETKILARYTRDGDAFSYLRTDYITNTGADQEHLIRVVDFYIREQNGTIVGELQHGEPGIASPEVFRQWVLGGLNGISRWNGNNNIIPTERGTFNYYTQSNNQRGPDIILMPGIYHLYNDEGESQTNYLTQRVKTIMYDVYENDIAPWMGEFAPDIQEVDSLAVNFSDNQYMNQPFLAPNSHPLAGEAGRVGVDGEAPNNIYHAFSRIRSVEGGPLQDDQLTRATSQESMAAFGLMSRTPSDTWAEYYQSVVHNATSLTRPSLLDGKLMRAVWERTYGPPVRNHDDILMLEDVFGKPDY